MRRTLRAAAVLAGLLSALPVYGEGGRPAAQPPSGSAVLNERLGALLGQQGGLTAAEVAQRAMAQSFTIQAHREELNQAAAAVDQALVAYFPHLTVGGRYTRFSHIDPPVIGNLVAAPSEGVGPLGPGAALFNLPLSFQLPDNQYALQASLHLPLSDFLLVLRPIHASVLHAREAAALNEEAARRKTARDARIAYYTWVRAQLQVLVAQQALVQARGHLLDVRSAFTAGTASQADVQQVEYQSASAELLLERAQGLAVLLADQVRTAMHDPPGRRYEIGEDVRDGPPPAPETGDFAALYAEAVEKRPEIRALDRTAWSLREHAKAARAGMWPKLAAFGELTYANPNPRYLPPLDRFDLTWAAGAELSWSPNDLANAVAAGRKARARAAQAEAQKNALGDAVRAEVMEALQALRVAQVAIRTTARGLAAAEEAYRVRRSLFINGHATSVELVDAETELTRARLEALNALVDIRIARIRLLFATGRDLAA